MHGAVIALPTTFISNQSCVFWKNVLNDSRLPEISKFIKRRSAYGINSHIKVYLDSHKFIMNNMLQIIALFAVSWLIVWLFDKNNLSVLGLTPNRDRLKTVAILFIVTTICCSTEFLLKNIFAKEQYIINPALTSNIILFKIWETFRGVLTEELLCRGVLLYILIKKIGPKWAIIISSVVFGMLHWLNSSIFGHIISMSTIFIYTFTMGLLLAYSYWKTSSILMPLSIHFAWNLTEHFIFPDPHTGSHVFILATPPPIVTVSYFIFYLIILFPKISAIGLDYLIIRREKQIEFPKLFNK